MIFPLAIAALSIGMATPSSMQNVVASDYFPLVAGQKRTYSDSAMSYSVIVNEVGKPEVVNDVTMIPVLTYIDGRKADEIYYRVEPDAILIVAYGEKKVPAEPRPLFKVGSGRQHWDYTGSMMFLNDRSPITMTGESRPGGKRKVLGKEVDTLIVKLDATIGISSEQSYTNHQEIVFGKGIGMVQMDETAVVAGKKRSHVIKLVSLDDGSGSL